MRYRNYRTLNKFRLRYPPHATLCLNNFPTAPDSPDFTLTLTDPAGHTFRETYTYSQDGVVSSRGDVSRIRHEDDFPTPGISLGLYLPASFPAGDWTASASTQDGQMIAGPTPFTRRCDAYQCLNILADLNTNPFISPEYSWEGPSFANRETIYLVGAAFPPNTAIMVAFYQQDPSAGTPEVGLALGTAKYAASVTTDNTGSFQAPFLIGDETQRGEYYAVAAPQITSSARLGPMGARFSIK